RQREHEEIVVGSPISNRQRRELEEMIGLFLNTVVLRTDMSGAPSFRELLRRVREVTVGAYAHQDMPIEKLFEALQPKRDLSYSPLFQVMFVLLDASFYEVKFGDRTSRWTADERGASQFDLTLYMVESDGGLNGYLEYNTDLFDVATVRRLRDHFESL